MSLCFRAYTQQQFVEAIASSRSLRQALLVLGVSPKESNYRAARRRIEKLNLDIYHFCKSGPAYARGRQTPLEAYFDGTVSRSLAIYCGCVFCLMASLTTDACGVSVPSGKMYQYHLN